MSRSRFHEVARSADVFLNVSGASFIPDSLGEKCVKVFVDTDPGYNQIMLIEKSSWSENIERWCKEVAAHDCHFTYAENIGSAECLVPDAGYRWHTTRPPVIVDMWSSSTQEPPNRSPWTTVLTWNSFKGPLLYKGVEYKGKGAQFKKIADLPTKVKGRLCIALGGRDAPREWLRKHGWIVLDGPGETLTPQRYHDFVSGSRGEVSTAKHVYVALRTGWFSCRSICYLAAGRPVIMQDTAFGKVLPTGEGLFSFDNEQEIPCRIDAVECDYSKHSRAARAIAEEFFRAETVLAKLLKDIGL
jgi:hypothetical protein